MTTPLWLGDIEVGNTYRSDSYTVTAEEIIDFARRYDPQPFHLGEATAAGTVFDGLASSGWHTAAITMRLLVTGGLPIAHGIIGLGIELAWPTPTRPGDILHVELVITDIRISRSIPDRGIVTAEYDTRNEHGEIRQHTTAKIMVFARPHL
ncbi:MaoC family dehydratase [Nocardia sp. NPDC049707]|uniref:MaoC family dehydratase n=1 Tax=Nocardia sp. NPDC049707 TaxID=3154735 RepID=UPI003414FD19